MFLLATLLAVLSVTSAGCAEGTRPPNVIVLSIDTLRRDALGAFAASAGPLPAFDRLAAESVRFENAFSSASWTLPAHASLFTGLYPDRHGATDRRVTLAEDVATLAGLLAARGYETAALTGGGFLRAKYGLGRGFERYAFHETAGKQDAAESGADLRARLAAYLGAREEERPLFLFLHTYAVHNYYDGRDEAVARTGQTGLKKRKANVACLLGRNACPPEAWDGMRALYRAELELMDEALAGMRAELERAGVWQDAIVVLLSDHGEGFAPDLERIHHGGRLHADQLRIPLLVRGPGFAPRAEPAPVSIVDLMPTLLELAAVPVPADLDGRSLVTSLRSGAPLVPRPLLAMEHYFVWQGGSRETADEVLDLPRELAVIDGAGCFLSSERGDELYPLADTEQRASTLTTPEQAAAYRALAGERPRARRSTAAVREDEELRRELDALGYGGDDE